MRKLLARFGKWLYLKFGKQEASLDALFKAHILKDVPRTHFEFERMTDAEKQMFYRELRSLLDNQAFELMFHWEVELQREDTMRRAATDFDFRLGKMSIYGVENFMARIKEFAGRAEMKEEEEFDKHSVL